MYLLSIIKKFYRFDNACDLGNQGSNVLLSTGGAIDVRNQASISAHTTGINLKGGGPKKSKFNWDSTADEILRKSEEIARKTEGNFKKNLLKIFRDLMLENKQIKYTGTESAVSARLSKLAKPKPISDKVNFCWSDSIDQFLLKCGIEAQAKKERDRSLSYIRILFDKFTTTHPNYEGSDYNLRSRFHRILRESDPEVCNEIRKEYEFELENEEMERIEDKLNIPENMSNIKRLLAIGIKHGEKALFKAMCSQCGKLLITEFRNSRKWKKVESPDLKNRISEIYEEEPKNIPYREGEKLFVCQTCNKIPNILSEIKLLSPQTNLMEIPQELLAITNPTELGLISLLGVYHVVHRQENPMHRVFQHLQGEVNLLSKQERDYVNMFGIMCDKKPMNYRKDRFNRIRKALTWLRQYNHLYDRFYSNCETLYPEFRPKQNPLLLKGNIEFSTNKGQDLRKALGEEEIGYFIPATNFEGERDFEESDFVIGVTHPKEDWRELGHKESFRRLTHPGILSPNLEALAFPKEFPGGTGSYDPSNSKIKHRDWCKLLILNFDPRFRRCRFFLFFSIDRFIKMSLLAYRRCVVAPVGDAAIKAPTVADIKDNPYNRYGNKVPATVPGSKTYWWNKTQDVYAISQEMGRNPDFFLTITTNDNWPEIQRCVNHLGYDEFCEKCPHEEDPSPATEYATECSIAFNERWKRLKKEILFNTKGELGNVVRYWFRREYQKRGAVHIHGVVWVDPETKPELVVRAEMPRGNDQNDPILKELRSLVNKFQIHKCTEERCFYAGTKHLQKCKYGFPAPLAAEIRPDESGLKKIYIRRHEEDQRVVPYCLSMLLIMRAHTNIQEVSASGWEMYLTKYMTKPEPSARVQYGPAVDKMTNPQRFLQMRVIGAVEANDILLQFPATESNVEVLYLPVDIDPKFKVLKRRHHMPEDEESTEVFYDSKFEKYLYRPKELKSITYPDFYRQYQYRGSEPKTDDINSDDSEDEDKETIPVNILKDLKGRTIFKRKHPIVVRFPFFEPYGENQEKFCLKLLITRNAYDIGNIDSILSPGCENYLAQCLKQNLWDKAIALDFLNDAHQKGFSESRLLEFALKLHQFNYLHKAEAIKFFTKLRESETMFPKSEFVYNYDEDSDLFGDLPGARLDLEPLNDYLQSFNKEQYRIFHHIRQKIETKQQILASIMGPAGTGKSHLLKGLCALFKEKKDKPTYRSFCILAPTGSAAYLIKGQTIHSMFRFDTNLKSHVRRNSMDEFFIRMCDTLLIDEMSMINYDLFDCMEFQLRRFGAFSKPFGGKDVIFFGDPAQLPSRGMPFFCHSYFEKFEVFTLNLIIRQGDEEFARMLQQIRIANVTEEVEQYFQKRLFDRIDYDLVVKKDIRIIVAHRAVRDGFNENLLNRLPGEDKVFIAKDTDLNNRPLSDKQQEDLEALTEKFPRKVRIRINALVMLTRNIRIHKGLVNGMLAKVVGWGENYVTLKSLDSDTEFPVYVMKQTLKDYGEDKYIRRQIPIILGWATTVHKVQGMTLDKAYVLIDENIFGSGMAYVALSRVKRIKDLRLRVFVPSKIKLSDYYRDLIKWFEYHDVFSFNRDTNFPMPEWGNSRIADRGIENTAHSQKVMYESDSDEEMFSQRSQLSQDEDIEMLSQRSQWSQAEDIEMLSQTSRKSQTSWIEVAEEVNEFIPVDESIELIDECVRILRELWTQNLYIRGIDDLAEFLQNYADFNNRILNFLRSSGRPINSDFDLPRRYPFTPVPPKMRDCFNLVCVPGDGNCFYYAVSMALFGNINLMPVIRYAILVTLMEYRVYFQKWIEEKMGENFIGHLLGVGTSSCDAPNVRKKYPSMTSNHKFNWADKAEQLAASIAIDKPIRIYIEVGSGNHTICCTSDQHQNSDGIFVQLKDEHFDALIPLTNQPTIDEVRNKNLMWDFVETRMIGVYPYK